MRAVNRRMLSVMLLLVLCLLATQAAVSAQAADVDARYTGEERTPQPAPAQLKAEIDGSRTGQPITKYIYGQFIEHLGNCIDHGLWSEMLDDRKFFYPVDSSERLDPVNRRRMRRWRPVGPDEFVVMDREHSYVGEHTPVIKLEGETPHGIRQAGLALRRDKKYTGRVVLAGHAGANVEVSLIWGPGPGDRQTIPIRSLQGDYTTYPLAFTSKADTGDGRLEIVGSGKGSFHVGAVSLMPADNLHGFRSEVIQLLKQLNSGFYRWPGGNFVSGYDWRDGIGDRDKRPPRYDYAWSAMESNDVGTDDFMILCHLLDVEPYISVNAGFGDAHSAAQWVEYANGSLDTPMGKLRAANGHPEPYNVKWWGIGNEMYGDWQLGHMSLRHYVIKHNMFAKAMRQVDPTIKLLASGASPDEMTVTGNSRRITGEVLTEYGSQADWTGGLLSNCADCIDVMTEHFYCQPGRRYDLEKGGYVRVDESLIDWARRPANRVRCKVEHYEEYLKRIPALREKRIPINIDEWHYGRPTLRIALSYAWAFHEMFRHSDIITMANYTFATGCINYNRTEASFNTTGLLFKLYRDHFGTVPVEVSGNSPPPPPQYPVGGDQPQVNAGSDNYPLDIVAALSPDRKVLTVAVLNPTESAQEVNVSFKGVDLQGKGGMWQMTGPDVSASNRLGRKPRVEIVETAVKEVPNRLKVPPISISLYELDVR